MKEADGMTLEGDGGDTRLRFGLFNLLNRAFWDVERGLLTILVVWRR